MKKPEPHAIDWAQIDRARISSWPHVFGTHVFGKWTNETKRYKKKSATKIDSRPPHSAKTLHQPDGQQRPDLIGNVHATPCVPGTFFNTCAFGQPALGSFGNVRRNSVQGPGYQIWDFSLFKNFAVSERAKVEFRAEFFNLFNHPNLQFAKSGPQNSINTTTFGTPQFGFLTAARDPRQIQFALKLSF